MFFIKMVDLGLLMEAIPRQAVANVPLFCLPKLGQPGQRRILFDMQRVETRMMSWALTPPCSLSQGSHPRTCLFRGLVIDTSKVLY
jgi:hypothetical protein